MFLVGGGILVHGIPGLHDWIHHLSQGLANFPGAGGGLAAIAPISITALIGAISGAAVLAVVSLARGLRVALLRQD
jgi:predicted DNA repair protein MutK